MTRTERLQNLRGFSWAPSSPHGRQSRNTSGSSASNVFPSFDGGGSEEGLVTSKGLHATLHFQKRFVGVPTRITYVGRQPTYSARLGNGCACYDQSRLITRNRIGQAAVEVKVMVRYWRSVYRIIMVQKVSVGIGRGYMNGLNP